MSSQGTPVGSLYYETTLETAGLLAAQRKIEQSLKAAGDAGDDLQGRINKTARAINSALNEIGTEQTQKHLRKARDEIDAAGDAADKMRQQMRQVAPQVTDIVTQLVSGADPLTILVQQGGQLKDQFGSAGAAAAAIGRYLASLVTPVTVVVSAAALLSYALWKGEEQSEELAKALAMTGNTAGVTEGQFNSMAQSLSSATNTSIGSAREALLQLVKDGKLSGDAFVSAGAAVQRWAKVTGQSAEEVAKGFSGALRDPVGWALRMNEQVRFLNAELYKQIKALQDVGEHAKAATIAFDALNAKLASVKNEAGYLEEIWGRLKRLGSVTLDIALSWGRNGTPQDALAEAQQRLGELKGPTPWKNASLADAARAAMAQATGRGDEFLQAQIQAQEAIVSTLQENVRLADRASQIQGETTRREQDQLKWAQRVEASMTERQRLAKELAAANAEADRTGASPEERAQVLAAIRERYAGIAGEEEALSQARTNAAIAGAKRVEAATAAGIQRSAELIEAQHAAGLASDQAYYDTRRRLAEQDGANQTAAIDREMQAVAAQKISAKNGADAARLELERSQKLADLAAQRVQAVSAAKQRVLMLDMQQELQAAQQRERLAQTVAETQIEAETNALEKIEKTRQENIRRAREAARMGQITSEQRDADIKRTNTQAQQGVRQQVLSINPLAQLEKEYQDRLSIVQRYEQAMAQAGADGAQWVADKKAEIGRTYELQRLALAEQEFAGQSAANQALMNGVNALGQTTTGVITGLVTQTMTAQDAMRALAGVVLNEAVGALVQVGLQYIKNALIGQAADKALMATKAANAALYTTAIGAQVAVTTALAAQSAFAATAAIPIVGPALAPAAAAAAGAGAAALGAPAVAAAPVAGARRYGGPTAAGSLYQVNESGAPEMWTASNGAQYMLAGSNGRVTPADQVGAGANVTLQVTVENNVSNAGVSVSQDSAGNARIVINEVASQISERRGPVWGALRTTNVQGRPG